MTGRAWAWLIGGVAAGALIAGALATSAIAAFWPDLPEAASPPPQFVDESGSAGVDHVYDGDFEYFVGGGVAVLDCDEDGRSDLYLAGGTNPSGLYRNDSPVGGALRFGQVLDSTSSNLTEVTGAYPIDIDSDSHTDLAVLRFGEDVLLRGQGDCTFERANETWSLDAQDDWTVGFSATWEGDAAMPTLAFGNYLAEDGRRPAPVPITICSVPRAMDTASRSPCPPAGAPCRSCSVTGTDPVAGICG